MDIVDKLVMCYVAYFAMLPLFVTAIKKLAKKIVAYYDRKDFVALYAMDKELNIK